MPFLSSLRPLLRGSASVAITLAVAADDALSVVVTPKLDQCDPDTTDAARAALQAALARPIRLLIPAGTDPDAEFAAALSRINDARAPVVDDLREYLDTLSQAQQTAKIESAKKDAKKDAKKPGKEPSKPSAAAPTTAAAPAPEAHDAKPEQDEADDAQDDTGAPTTAAPTAAPVYASAADAISASSPAPAAAASLFD